MMKFEDKEQPDASGQADGAAPEGDAVSDLSQSRVTEAFNLLTNREKVRQALIEMGDYDPETSDGGPFTFEAACRFVDGVGSEKEGCTIYGDCGLHRYPVLEDGRIFFSKTHAVDEEAIQRAIAAGFEIL